MTLPSETTLDPREYARRRIASCRPALGWDTSHGASDPVAWQTELRAAFVRALGDLEAWERPDLNPRIEETVVLEGYRRERVQFTTRPGLDAVGYLLVPDGLTAPSPAVVCLPGHGRGMSGVAGIAADGTQRPLGAPDEYEQDFALACVRRGWVAFVLEQISFGNRRDPETTAKGASASSCHPDSMAALMLGECMPGWRTWDATRAVDYLLARPDLVDPARVVTMGISGGGLTSLFTAAVDTRVAVCVVSGYFCTFADSVLSIHHCVDNYVPGLLCLCEMPDLAGLVAPRPLFAESGDKDPIFPLHGFRAAVSRAEEIYAAFGHPDRFGHEVFEGGHRFHGEDAFTFVERLFMAR